MFRRRQWRDWRTSFWRRRIYRPVIWADLAWNWFAVSSNEIQPNGSLSRIFETAVGFKVKLLFSRFQFIISSPPKSISRLDSFHFSARQTWFFSPLFHRFFLPHSNFSLIGELFEFFGSSSKLFIWFSIWLLSWRKFQVIIDIFNCILIGEEKSTGNESAGASGRIGNIENDARRKQGQRWKKSNHRNLPNTYVSNGHRQSWNGIKIRRSKFSPSCQSRFWWRFQPRRNSYTFKRLFLLCIIIIMIIIANHWLC